MKLQKIILCVAVALTAFGASLGLLEIGRYISAFFQPTKAEVKLIKPLPSPSVVYAPPIVEFKQPVFTPPEVSNSDEEETCEFDEEGDYSLIGDKPKGFEDLSEMSIVTNFYNSKTDKVIPIKPYGWIWMTKKFKFSWLNIANKRISFVTQSKKGVSYQFDGKFVEEEIKLKDENDEEYTEKVVLKGRLTKWRDGKKIAESKVKFSESCGC
jgi:hypothetical protein